MLLAVVAACGTTEPEPGPEPVPPAPPASACALLTDTLGTADETRVALLEPVSASSAPRARNESERFLFQQAYQTLIRVDCHGRVGPGLAESWTSEDDGRSWRFVLSEEARFWDGTRVTSEDVIREWESEPSWGGRVSITAESERVFEVQFDGPHTDVPREFAEPDHAITRPQEDPAWPVGTGPYRLEGPVPSTDFSHLEVNAYAVDRRSPTISFRLATTTDARDQLDDRIDVMITGDPDVLDYAARRSGMTSMPLPWNRTYVLMSPTRVRELRADVGTTLPVVPMAMRQALASDAVRGDAREHESKAWWEEELSCPAEVERLRELPPAVPTAAYRVRGPRRVVYVEGDAVAQALAERIVALAMRPVSVEQSTALANGVPGLGEADYALLVEGSGPDEFEESLNDGDEFLFVLALPSRSLDPCYHLTRLAERVPWLNIGWLDPAATILPLIDTRKHVVARDGAVSLSVGWDGTVLIGEGAAGGRQQ